MKLSYKGLLAARSDVINLNNNNFPDSRFALLKKVKTKVMDKRRGGSQSIGKEAFTISSIPLSQNTHHKVSQ